MGLITTLQTASNITIGKGRLQAHPVTRTGSVGLRHRLRSSAIGGIGPETSALAAKKQTEDRYTYLYI